MKLVQGQMYTVSVKEIVPAGAVVTLEDGSTQLVHISNISNMFVRDVGNFLEVGQTLEAEAVEGRARPVELSFKHLDLHPLPKAKESGKRNAPRSEYGYYKDEDEEDRGRRSHSPKPKNKKRKFPQMY